MKFTSLIFLILFAFLNAAIADDDASIKVCQKLNLKGSLTPPLLEIEKRLVCGEQENSQSDAWKSIPPTQAELSLRSFLKDRGYYYPEIVIQDGVLNVSIGKPTLVQLTKVEGAPVDIHLEENREIVGERLTPKLLRKVNKWVAVRLQTLGYACALASSEADPETGTLVVTVRSGEKLNLIGETDYTEEDLNPNVLHRYDAFQFNHPYDGKLVSITESRLLREGLVQSVHLVPHCEESGIIIDQEALTGPPRVIRLGVGVSTESLLIAKATWKNARLDKNGSSISFSGYASAIDQSLNATYNWYPWADSPRLEIKPMAQFTHVLRNSYEYYLSEGQVGPAWTWDNSTGSFSLNVGPDFEYFQEISGIGPNYSNFFNLKTTLMTASHDFEYFAKSPRTGYSAAASVLLNNQAVGSTSTGEKIKIDGKYLWNFNQYDPPLFILGLRGGAATTLTNQQWGPGIGLPPPYLSYLGGSTTIRGYNIDELPENGIGGLTDYYVGAEFILGSLAWNFLIAMLPQTITPFFFLDAGALGNQPLEIDSPVYFSPGVGLRWASTIGPIRFTIAQGYPRDTPGHLQFYFSLGEEF